VAREACGAGQSLRTQRPCRRRPCGRVAWLTKPEHPVEAPSRPANGIVVWCLGTAGERLRQQRASPVGVAARCQGYEKLNPEVAAPAIPARLISCHDIVDWDDLLRPLARSGRGGACASKQVPKQPGLTRNDPGPAGATRAAQSGALTMLARNCRIGVRKAPSCTAKVESGKDTLSTQLKTCTHAGCRGPHQWVGCGS
jgi:hypothetical protein